ncbi:DUF6415 family natural product biosynthesis protein [Streptomyces sp. BSE6.1]|uniref:DUF6415 family natural product biosynthesis protein n=1 Tax=Streptomyces sp. BSE6.1 TaxID=2605730 RepID=UPI001F1A2735|nr:DUF6415 family natural product biosynthesis protein [Streptomyces sp. BSE6.1]
MTGTATVRRPRPVPRWNPPLDADDLAAVLARLQGWRPYDGEALLDDVGDALDDVIPADDAVADIAARLDAHLVQLVDIAVASEAADKDATVRAQVDHARRLLVEPIPEGRQPAVGHLRRLAWSVHELAERLAELRCLRGTA